MNKKEILIHFTNVDVCLRDLKELGIKVSRDLKKFIIQMHDCVRTVSYDMPINIMAEVCYRSANKIIDRIEIDTKIRFVRYKKHNYTF